MRPLSDYETFQHQDAFTTARESVSREVTVLYADLDAARTRSGAELHLTTMGAALRDVRTTDFVNASTPILPGVASVEWLPPDSPYAAVLAALQLGTGTESTVAGIYQRLGLNDRGLVTGRAAVELHPLGRPERAARITTLAAHTRMPRPKTSGTAIAEGGGKAIGVTLLADSWKVQQGFSAYPFIPDKADRHFASVVAKVHANAVKALPAGRLVQAILGFNQRLPDSVAAAVLWPPDRPEMHVMSRPYSAERPSRTVGDSASLRVGQVDIFAETHSEGEPGAVRRFETGALFDDPRRPGESPYFKALNARGPYFMGCRDGQRRGCR